MRFKGKTAIVTGAGRGIGRDYARGVAAEGANVVVAEFDEAGGAETAEIINKEGGNAIFVKTDVSSEESVEAMAQKTFAQFGGVDLLVNNAAIFGGMRKEPLLEIDLPYYRHFMEVNMNGALLVTRAVYKSMAERGGGAIVNQSSTGAYTARGYYSLSKLAINGLTNCLAVELGPKNIRVNAIAPGPVDTEATRTSVPEERRAAIVASLPLKRMGETQDMVDACIFLLSDESRWITGRIMCVDGGMMLRP